MGCFAGAPIAAIANGKYSSLSAVHLSRLGVAAHVLEVPELKITIDILQVLFLILGAPLVRGIIARMKARMQTFSKV